MIIIRKQNGKIGERDFPLSYYIFIFILYTDAYQDHEDRIEAVEEMIGDIPSIIDPPNDRYSTPKNLGTWDNINTVDQFFNSFNHANAYNNGTIKLELGDYVDINYNGTSFRITIVGFDCEHKQIAADGTIYDNGYGILFMMNQDNSRVGYWNEGEQHGMLNDGAYNNSTVHTVTIPSYINQLKYVVGNHIKNRNVLLSNSVANDRDRLSDSYIWTESYGTLPSVGQINGYFGQYRNIYDDGEANYRLPLYIKAPLSSLGSSAFWTRGIFPKGDNWYSCAYIVRIYKPTYEDYFKIDVNGSPVYGTSTYGRCVFRPLIYLG